MQNTVGHLKPCSSYAILENDSRKECDEDSPSLCDIHFPLKKKEIIKHDVRRKKSRSKKNVLPILRHFIGSSLAGLYPSWQIHLPTSIVMLRKQIRSAPTQSSSLRQSTRPEIHIRRRSSSK